MSELHRITWDGDHATFHCDGDQTSPCRNYPECECEVWYTEEQPDGTRKHPHPDTAQARCWQLDWLEAVPAADTWEGGDGGIYEPACIDGPITTTFKGDFLEWDFVAVSEPA